MRSISSLALGVTAAASFGLAGTALGGIVDLRDLNGNFDQFTWGQPDTTIYAQSVQADDTFLSEFRFRATPSGNGDLLFNVIVTGARADGGGGLGMAPDFSDIRFNSGQLSINGGAGQTEVTVNPNLGVTNGELLFFVLDTFSFPGSGSGSVRATAFNGQDQYTPGEFVFINTGGLGANTLQDLDNFAWSHRFDNGEDLAIFAEFTSPAPGALALLAVGGLLGTRRRRRA